MRILIPILAIAAVGALLFASSASLAVVPGIGTVRLGEMSWGGLGRVWLVCAMLAVSGCLASIWRERTISAAFAGLGLGVVIDVLLSVLTWRRESLAMLADLGMQHMEQSIRFGAGGPALLLAILLMAAMVASIAYVKVRIV